MKVLVLICFSFCLSPIIFAQNIFEGKWTTHQNIPNFSSGLDITLEIGAGEKNILFPAQLSIRLDSFHATYRLLMSKKNQRQLAIGSQKFAETEIPFSLENWPMVLNGCFDYGKDIKNNAFLELNRIPMDSKTKKQLQIKEEMNLPADQQLLAKTLQNILEKTPIVLTQMSNQPWVGGNRVKLLEPKASPKYLGLIDTLFSKSNMGAVEFLNNNDLDIVSMKLDNKYIVDQVDSKKRRDNEDFILDTGMNILVFYADDFGKNMASTASANLIFERFNYLLDFKSRENLGATFIAVKIYHPYDEEQNTKFQDMSTVYFKEKDTKDYISNKVNSNDASNLLNRTDKVIGNIVSTAQHLDFAIWDDALEDGDSISLSINGKWIVRGFPVKKQPQQLSVTLSPGPNVITFIADNEGSIVPNTAILEIIDGRKRKSFNIETNLRENNVVKIYYDVKP